MKCKFVDCERESRAMGFCGGHYQQYVKRGESGMTSLRERLKIDRTVKCLIDGCENLVEKKHLCGKHYQRLKNHGDPLKVLPHRSYLPVELKFNRRVVKKEGNGCWLWTGARNVSGYGHIRAREIGEQLAHRVSYRLYVGEIPDGMFVLHKCDNPPCCNPDHLFLGDADANTQDMINKGRSNSFNGEFKRVNLTDEQVRMIRDKNHKISDLCDRFNISNAMVGLIRARKSYQHVT